MKITTTFWSEEKFDFSELFYINAKTQEIVFQSDLNDMLNTFNFFQQITKFVKNFNMRKEVFNSDLYYQFAVMKDGEITPIKWFDIVIDDKTVISHDIAFETTIIYKNDIRVALGGFPFGMKHYAKHREYNVKARAYKYIGNQIKEVLFKK